MIRLFSRRRYGGEGQISNRIAVPATAKRIIAVPATAKQDKFLVYPPPFGKVNRTHYTTRKSAKSVLWSGDCCDRSFAEPISTGSLLEEMIDMAGLAFFTTCSKFLHSVCHVRLGGLLRYYYRGAA